MKKLLLMLSMLALAPAPLLAAESELEVAAHASPVAATPGTPALETPVPAVGSCKDGVCQYRMTAAELLAAADKLISEHRFDDAAPLLAALEQSPQLALEREFLKGYAAVETGRLDEAIKTFRRILADNPGQTRVRLELGRALMLKGKALSADHHFRLAEQDKGLPPEVRDYVRTSRTGLRSFKSWNFNTDFGFAPDSNITNGASAETVDIQFGPFSAPLVLDENARAKSGTGQFMTFSANGRVGLKGETRLAIDADTGFTNYRGKRQDDGYAQLAIGPEFETGTASTLAVQAVGAYRYFGGQTASHAVGLRTSFTQGLGISQRVNLSLDARRTVSGFSSAYSGWQFAANATYEHVLGRRMIGSAALFARRDALNGKGYANVETGFALALGGELPKGLTFGLSGGASRAWFDAPLAIFSAKPRNDWRLNGRATLGLRSIRVLGFSPSVSYSWNDNRSTYALYKSERSRVRFALARYF